METNRLRYFCAIVELGSLSKASEVLGISHSGLSKAISNLQSETDLQLFRPLGRGLEVTPEGKKFYPTALEILRLVEGLPQLKSESAPVIKIGVSEVLSVSCSGVMAEALQQSMKLSQMDVGEIETAILADEIDFGIASVLRPRPEFEYLNLGRLRFNSYAREDLYKKYKENVPYTIPHTDLPQNLMGYKIRDGWPEQVPRKPYFYVKSFPIALELLKSGHGAAFIPEFVAKKENASAGKSVRKLVVVKEHRRAKVDKEQFLIKLKNTQESVAMKKVSREIRKLCVN